MHILAGLLSAFTLLLTAVLATPVRHSPHDQPDTGQQQAFHNAPMPQPHRSQPSSHGHLDAAPNSVGMLFTTAEDGDEVVHVWLPIGRRVYTRDSPDLPLHPVTARVTTMIRSTPRIANREHLDKIVCRLYPRWNHTAEEPAERKEKKREGEAIAVRRRNGLVHLADLSERSWREVEGYECS